jgi:EAL domain-containing protein (putative c-di-GMP-specific phosphodiesterase class I)
VRWAHPRHGLIRPDEFVPLAERSGLIRPLTAVVLRQALGVVAAWRRQGLQLGIAVNLSARSLLDPELPDVVARLLRRYGVPAGQLTLEITESSIMTDPARTIGLLERLAAMGVRLSVDDFGTGYSSLSYLKRLPVDEVKIDKSFVTDMERDADDEVIVRSIVDLGGNLSLDVVAEGVEDRATWERLARMGCTMAQGYFLHRPMPPQELPGWLAGWRPPAPASQSGWLPGRATTGAREAVPS